MDNHTRYPFAPELTRDFANHAITTGKRICFAQNPLAALSIKDNLFPMNHFKILLLTSILSGLVTYQATASQALDPEIIMDLKKGHKQTCTPTVSRQLITMGIPINNYKIELYCECLGNFYFNDFTKIEFEQMKDNKGRLPTTITDKRRDIQKYCADVHFK